MSNVTEYSQYNNKALAGFWSWLGRAVNKVVRAIRDFLPRNVFMVLDDATNGDGSFNWGGVFDITQPGGGAVQRFSNPTDYPLTTSDEFMLDGFVVNFTAFIKPLFEDLKSVRDGQSTVAEIKDIYNQAQRVISVIKYCINISLQDTRGRYSINALKSRNEFLLIQVGTIEQTLNELISQYNISVKPRQENISFTGSDYSILDFELPNIFANTVKTFAVSAIDDVEITDQDNDTGIIDDIVVPPSPTSDKASSGNLYKWAFAALLLLLLLKNRRKSINSK